MKLILILLLFINIVNCSDVTFRNTKWGMSIDEVSKVEKLLYTKNDLVNHDSNIYTFGSCEFQFKKSLNKEEIKLMDSNYYFNFYSMSYELNHEVLSANEYVKLSEFDEKRKKFLENCHEPKAKDLYGLQPDIEYRFLRENDKYLFYKGSYEFGSANGPEDDLYYGFLKLLSKKYGKYRSYKNKHVWTIEDVEISLFFEETIFSKWYSKHYELNSIEYKNLELESKYYKKEITKSKLEPLDKL